jgi:hypothetical protein
MNAHDPGSQGPCEQGPYKYVRHPFYMSYMTAFLGMFTAFPGLVTGTRCVLNIMLFIHIAFDDERVLARSRLGRASIDRSRPQPAVHGCQLFGNGICARSRVAG